MCVKIESAVCVCAFHRNHNTLRKLHRARRTETTRARSHSFHGQPALCREQKTQKKHTLMRSFSSSSQHTEKHQHRTGRKQKFNFRPSPAGICLLIGERCVINAAAPASHQKFIFHPQAQAGNVQRREYVKRVAKRELRLEPQYFFRNF